MYGKLGKWMEHARRFLNAWAALLLQFHQTQTYTCAFTGRLTQSLQLRTARHHTATKIHRSSRTNAPQEDSCDAQPLMHTNTNISVGRSVLRCSVTLLAASPLQDGVHDLPVPSRTSPRAHEPNANPGMCCVNSKKRGNTHAPHASLCCVAEQIAHHSPARPRPSGGVERVDHVYDKCSPEDTHSGTPNTEYYRRKL